MNIDYNNIITFEQFKENFLYLYNNNYYIKILNEGIYFSNKIKEKTNKINVRFNPLLSPETKLNIVFDKLQTKSNESSLYKNLVLINSIFDNHSFIKILNNCSIDIDTFIKTLNKTILISKIIKNNLYNEYIENSIKMLINYFGYNKYKLYILKIYELKILQSLDLQNNKKKTK